MAPDFGVHPITLSRWLRRATQRRAPGAAYPSQANLPS
ncbi:hypothetical protein [Streptomyces sp. NPDC057363]